jgi:MFS family permease
LTRRPAQATDRAATYRQVFSSREFRSILSGHTVSTLGDQALRVALALLVYNDSHSPLTTAFAYSLTFLPWVVAGPLLSGYADRLPRRAVMCVGTSIRGLIVAAMAIPSVPIPAVLVLVFLSELLSPPIDAAGFAVLPDLLTGDRYVVGSSIVQGTGQAAQIIGFAAGGAMVAAMGARGAFALDAATFFIAAGCFQLALRRRVEGERPQAKTSFWSDTVDGFRISLGRPGPRGLLLLAWWGAVVLLVPEALAAPYAARVAHEGDAATGWLLAAQPAGMVLGMLLLARLVRPSVRLRLMHPMAVLGTLPLVVFLARPPLVPALALLVVSGVMWSYQVPLQGAFVAQIPAEFRGRAFGVAAAGLQVAQGIGVLAGGGIAEVAGVSTAIGVAGIAGAIGMVALAVTRPAALAAEPLPEPAAAAAT